ncbi:MAG: FadR/GntR family transcriptional regulator [Hyphomicrobiaceae bacterium]
MTRQVENVPSAQGSGKLAILRRLRPVRNLTLEVVEQIANEIRSGNLPPGSRLPTEHELMATLGVSRTVVREAIAALRAEGLVISRQGAGVFVTDASRAPLRISLEASSSLEDILHVMELRLAIEVEAAARAAERASEEHLRSIETALSEIEAAISRGEPAVNEDFAFHNAIAVASGNPKFSMMLEFLGRHIIPRQSIRASIGTPKQQEQYLRRIQGEHRHIFEAIRSKNPTGARRAMRSHLTGSLSRYRRLYEASSARGT